MTGKAGTYLALLHYPMYNKNLDVITTSVTNLDLHDIARVARTYNLSGFYVIHPSVSQRSLIERILGFWQDGYGGGYNPDRCQAFSIVEIEASLEEALESIAAREGQRPLVVATDARIYPNTIDYREMRRRLSLGDQPVVLLFGTGWGMTRQTMEQCDCILTPVAPQSDYNHLSVRSAVAIIVDRLLGEQWF